MKTRDKILFLAGSRIPKAIDTNSGGQFEGTYICQTFPEHICQNYCPFYSKEKY